MEIIIAILLFLILMAVAPAMADGLLSLAGMLLAVVFIIVFGFIVLGFIAGLTRELGLSGVLVLSAGCAAVYWLYRRMTEKPPGPDE